MNLVRVPFSRFELPHLVAARVKRPSILVCESEFRFPISPSLKKPDWRERAGPNLRSHFGSRSIAFAAKSVFFCLVSKSLKLGKAQLSDASAIDFWGTNGRPDWAPFHQGRVESQFKGKVCSITFYSLPLVDFLESFFFRARFFDLDCACIWKIAIPWLLIYSSIKHGWVSRKAEPRHDAR